MADTSPAARRRGLLVPLVAVGVVLLVAVLVLLVAVLVRPSPAASNAAKPAPTPAASGTPAPAPSTSGGDSQQHQQYRAYVSTLVQGGTAVLADLFSLPGCGNSRPECAQRLSEASQQVGALQQSLAATPAPSCLSTADQQFQDSLSFQKKGLDMAHDAILAQNRLRLMQGLLLTAAGVWRSQQAIVHGRQADC